MTAGQKHNSQFERGPQVNVMKEATASTKASCRHVAKPHTGCRPSSSEGGLAAKAAAAVSRRNVGRRVPSPCSTPATPALAKKGRSGFTPCSTPATPPRAMRSVPTPLPQNALPFSIAVPPRRKPSSSPSRTQEATSSPRSRSSPIVNGSGQRRKQVLPPKDPQCRSPHPAKISCPSFSSSADSSSIVRKHPPALMMADPDFLVDMCPMTPSTPTDTPTALTETALRRSEQLLADLVALGLPEETTVNLNRQEENIYSCPASSCPSPLRSQTMSPKASFRGMAIDADMVEIPAAFLDMLTTTWSKYRSLSQSPSQGYSVQSVGSVPSVKEDGSEMRVDETCQSQASQAPAERTPENDQTPNLKDVIGSTSLFVDSLASTTASITSPSTSAGSPCAIYDKAHGVQTSPMRSGSSTDVPAEFLSSISTTCSDSSFARIQAQLMNAEAQMTSPVVRRQMSAAPASVRQLSANCPQQATQFRPRITLPTYSISPTNVGPLVRPPVTCTVEQKITVRTTFHLH